MTRLTALRIHGDPEVVPLSWGPDPATGRYGAAIGTCDESPSGCRRARLLLAGEFHYDTAEEAVASASALIQQIKDGPAPL